VRLFGALQQHCAAKTEDVSYFEAEVFGKLRAATLALWTELFGMAATAASMLAAQLNPDGRETVYKNGQGAVLLSRLGEAGLIPFPSPLLGASGSCRGARWLGRTARTMLAQVGRPLR
jgi:hypothetical protein